LFHLIQILRTPICSAYRAALAFARWRLICGGGSSELSVFLLMKYITCALYKRVLVERPKPTPNLNPFLYPPHSS